MILAYHEVTPSADTAYSISCGRMEEHLRLVAQNGESDRRKFFVTFDDGEVSQFRYALPLLEKWKVKATFFVNAGFVGQSKTIKAWTQQFMDWRELRELIHLGHSVQSHGWSHEFLTECSEEELDSQLRRSKLTLEDKLGTAVDSISAPGGRWDGCVARACDRAGYKILFTSDPWIGSHQRGGIMLRGRFMVLRTSTVDTLEALLNASKMQLFRHRLQGQLKSTARTILGERRYHSLWKRYMRTDSSVENPDSAQCHSHSHKSIQDTDNVPADRTSDRPTS